jgi:hypothetical protein
VFQEEPPARDAWQEATNAWLDQERRESLLRACFSSFVLTHRLQRHNSTHEDLQEQSNDQDRRIQELLRAMDDLKADQRLRGWKARAHFDHVQGNSKFIGPCSLTFVG